MLLSWPSRCTKNSSASMSTSDLAIDEGIELFVARIFLGFETETDTGVSP